MKKYITIIFTLFTLLFLNSCKKEYVEPDELSDISWILGQPPTELMSRNVGEHFTIRDASIGATSHKWIIEEGNYFLRNGFDVDDDSLPLFINTELGLTSTDLTVHVLLNNPGLNGIRLYNTFNKPVTYRAADYDFEAVKEGNVWVIDTIIYIDVYETIDPAFKVRKDGMEIIYVRSGVEIVPREEWDTLTIEAGSELEFVDVTTVGRPAERTWYLGGSNPTSGDSVAFSSYYSLGTYTASVRCNRSYPLPQAGTSKHVPLIIKVIQSTLPFKQVASQIQADGSILISTSGDIVEFYEQEEYFTVHVENGDFSQDVEVTGVYKNSENSTQLILDINETIYADDIVTVTYIGSSIESVDERVLETFAGVDVTPYINFNANPLDVELFGFETEGGVEGRGGAEGWWSQESMENDTPTPLVWSRSVTEFYSGRASMQFYADYSQYPNPYSSPADNFKTHGPNNTAGLPLDAGAYYVQAWVKYVAGDITSFKIASIPAYTNAVLEFDHSRPNEWIKMGTVINIPDDQTTKINLVVDLAASPGGEGIQHFYVDDIQVFPVDIRPE